MGLLEFPVHGIITLTEPGPLCVDVAVELTCNLTGGIALNWIYQGNSVTQIRSSDAATQERTTRTVGGITFTVSVTPPTSPVIVSHISFVADSTMNGRTLQCSGESVTEFFSRSTVFSIVDGK